MRWKGLLFLVILIGIIFLLSLLFTDSWLERRLESAGSALVGAKVEFDGVDFSLLNLHLRWNRLQVTDPKNTMRNMVETGPCDVDIAFGPLLSGKVIIEKVRADSLRFGTRRETDGKLIRKKPAKPKEPPRIVQTVKKKLNAEISQMPVFKVGQFTRKINVDSLWKFVNLQSPRRIDSLKQNYETLFQQWNQKLETLPTEQDLLNLKKEAEAIKVDRIKTVADLQNTLTTVSNLYKKVEGYHQQVKSLRGELEKDLTDVKQVPALVKQWVEADYRRALGLAQLPDLSVGNVARYLVGRQIVQKVETVTDLIGTARHYASMLQSDKPKKERPPRLRGQDIHFVKEQALPDFWIKEISVSGEGPQKTRLAGAVRNIVSQQRVIGQPTTINLKGTRRDKAALKINGALDYRQDTPREELAVQADAFPMNNVKLTDFPLLPYRLARGAAFVNASLNMEGDNFQTVIEFRGTGIAFDFSDKPSGMNERLVQIAQSLARSIQEINFKAVIRQMENQFTFSLNSNLDELIAQKMKAIFSEEVEKARRQIEARVQQEVDKHRAELEQYLQAQEQKLRQKVTEVENRVNEQIALLEQKRKEIEDRIEAEKKKQQKKLEEEAKKKIQDLFKK